MNLINQLFAYFAPSPQKTAKQLSRIDIEGNKIQVEEWKDTTGFFTVCLYKDIWPLEVECFEKNFFPWELKDYCQADGWDTGKDFEEWWNDWSKEAQRPIVEAFLRIHEATLQKELDEYYACR